MTLEPLPGLSSPPVLLVLDLDNTLYPHEQYVAGAYRDIAAVLAAETKGSTEEIATTMLTLWRCNGSHWPHVFSTVLQKIGLPETPWIERILRLYHAHAADDLSLWPGMGDFLETARQICRLALISDGRPTTQRRKLRRLGLEHTFDPVLISGEFGADAYKPNPKMFAHMVRLSGVAPEDIVYIGDDPAVDVTGARATGLTTVRLKVGEYATTEPQGPEQAADFVVTTVDDLARVLGLETSRRFHANNGS